MLRITVAGFLISLIVGVVGAETIDMSGIVSNQSGKPVKGAIVSLPGKKLADTTDADGTYSLKVSSTAVNTAPVESRPESILLSKNVISLFLTSKAPVKIELFDMCGHLLKRIVNQKVEAGEYRIDLLHHPVAATMAVVRVSIGRQTTSFRYFAAHGGNRVTSSFATIASTMTGEAEALAKVQATVDSLKVSASGYIPKDIPISSYVEQINITLETITLDTFSFFVTSMKALQELSGSQDGFGGDFRFGKTGTAAGILGADSICQCIAERSMPGAKVKQWRAFLSASSGPDGKQVNAIERIGQGPWYDRLGRLLAPSITDLLNTRPMNGDPTIKNDLPNENGVPNHRPDGTATVDNHHMLTGSKTDGTLYSTTATCNDWTSTTASGKPRCGFAWPRGGMGKTEFGGGGGMSASHWISGWDAGGCEAGIDVNESTMAGVAGDKSVGKGGGYGGFYCFALNP